MSSRRREGDRITARSSFIRWRRESGGDPKTEKQSAAMGPFEEEEISKKEMDFVEI